MKSHFHMKRWTPWLALRKRQKGNSEVAYLETLINNEPMMNKPDTPMTREKGNFHEKEGVTSAILSKVNRYYIRIAAVE